MNPIKKWAVIIFLLLFVFYGIYESYKILLGPRIYIETPKDGETLSENLIYVKGSAKNVAFISLDGKPIFLDKEGRINEKLILFPGYNIMTIKAEDRFKRVVEKRMQLYLPGDMPKIEIMRVASSTENETASSSSETSSTSPQTSNINSN